MEKKIRRKGKKRIKKKKRRKRKEARLYERMETHTHIHTQRECVCGREREQGQSTQRTIRLWRWLEWSLGKLHSDYLMIVSLVQYLVDGKSIAFEVGSLVEMKIVNWDYLAPPSLPPLCVLTTRLQSSTFDHVKKLSLGCLHHLSFVRQLHSELSLCIWSVIKTNCIAFFFISSYDAMKVFPGLNDPPACSHRSLFICS